VACLFRTAAMPELFYSSKMKCPFRVIRVLLGMSAACPVTRITGSNWISREVRKVPDADFEPAVVAFP